MAEGLTGLLLGLAIYSLSDWCLFGPCPPRVWGQIAGVGLSACALLCIAALLVHLHWRRAGWASLLAVQVVALEIVTLTALLNQQRMFDAHALFDVVTPVAIVTGAILLAARRHLTSA